MTEHSEYPLTDKWKEKALTAEKRVTELEIEIEGMRTGCTFLGKPTTYWVRLNSYVKENMYDGLLNDVVGYEAENKRIRELALKQLENAKKTIAELEAALQYERNFPSYGVERRKIV